MRKIFLLVFCLIFFLGIATRVYTKDKKIFLEKDYEQTEKKLVYKISIDTFGDIYNKESKFGLKSVFLHSQQKESDEESEKKYQEKLKSFIKDHDIYKGKTLLESEKKIVFIYKNLIVKNIYNAFYNDEIYYYKAFYDDFGADKINKMFEEYFFDNYGKNILENYLVDFKLTKNDENDNKKYDEKNDYKKIAKDFLDVSCIEKYKEKYLFEEYIEKYVEKGYCESLLNIYLICNINDIIKDEVFYNVGVFCVRYNDKNKKNIFNLIKDLLNENINLYEISNIMSGYSYNQNIEKNLECLKDSKNDDYLWKFLNKSRKGTFAKVFDGTALGDVVDEYKEHYNIKNNIPNHFINDEENIEAYFALKEVKSADKSFYKFKWISQSQNDSLCSLLNEWHLFNLNVGNFDRDYIEKNNNSVFLKNNSLSEQKVIFDSGDSFYIIKLENLLYKGKIYKIDGNTNNKFVKEILDFDSSYRAKLAECLIDENKKNIENKVFGYFIKKNIDNGNIKILNSGFKEFLKRKYSI